MIIAAVPGICQWSRLQAASSNRSCRGDLHRYAFIKPCRRKSLQGNNSHGINIHPGCNFIPGQNHQVWEIPYTSRANSARARPMEDALWRPSLPSLPSLTEHEWWFPYYSVICPLPSAFRFRLPSVTCTSLSNLSPRRLF